VHLCGVEVFDGYLPARMEVRRMHRGLGERHGRQCFLGTRIRTSRSRCAASGAGGGAKRNRERPSRLSRSGGQSFAAKALDQASIGGLAQNRAGKPLVPRRDRSVVWVRACSKLPGEGNASWNAAGRQEPKTGCGRPRAVHVVQQDTVEKLVGGNGHLAGLVACACP